MMHALGTALQECDCSTVNGEMCECGHIASGYHSYIHPHSCTKGSWGNCACEAFTKGTRRCDCSSCTRSPAVRELLSGNVSA